MIVPFIKCECNYFREIVIRGLGRINIEAIRDLVEELMPYIKECSDKRQEKLRRMKKRDLTRLAIVRIFELMAEQRTLGKRIIDTTSKPNNRLYLQLHQQIQQQHQANENLLLKSFHEYVDSIHAYLDQEQDPNNKYSDLTVQIRLHFSIFIAKLAESVASDKRNLLFSTNSRTSLFYLCDKWSGRFSLSQHGHHPSKSGSLPRHTSHTSRSHPNQLYIHQSHYHHHNCYHFYEEIELAATRACAALLCCEDTLELLMANCSSEPVVFTWLTQLLDNASLEMKMYDYCKCTLPNEVYTLALGVCIELLELSVARRGSRVFEWMVQRCFRSEAEVADLCFIALAKMYAMLESGRIGLFADEEQHVSAVLALTLLNVGSSRVNVHETAIALLRILNRRYLIKNLVNYYFQEAIRTKIILFFALTTNEFKFQNLIKDTEKSTTNNVNFTSSDIQDSSLQPTLSPSSPTQRSNSLKLIPKDQSPKKPQHTDYDLINSLIIHSKSKIFLSEYLALKNPEQTMFLFCELTSRFEHCPCHQTRKDMLQLLIPWFQNLELVDPYLNDQTALNHNLKTEL